MQFLISVLILSAFIFAIFLMCYAIFKYTGFLLTGHEQNNFYTKAFEFVFFKGLNPELSMAKLIASSILLSAFVATAIKLT